MGYKGGKGQDGVYHRIINQIPPHSVFIECFFGHGAITKYKRPAACTIAIDVDASVISRFEGLYLSGDAGSRLPGSLAVCGDAISFLRSYDWKGGELVYADPPYLKRDIDGSPVRSWQGDIYKHEFYTIDQHTELLTVLKSLPCMVALSGYWSSLYESMLQGWRSISYQVGVQGGQSRTEWLWMNYAEPTALHDYRYLGENFREREKITRQKRRWRQRLQRMSSLQRYALLSSIAELNEPAGS
jgi:DNA adenine methylase